MQLLMEDQINQVEDYYAIYYQEMYYVAKRIIREHYLAEDIVQESFLKAFKCQDMIIDHSKLRAWLRTIVTRTAIDYLRKESKFAFCSIDQTRDECVHITGVENSVEEQISWKLCYLELKNLIGELPETLQEVIQLKLIGDCSDAEISRKLNITISAVKTRLHRARKRLKQADEFVLYGH